MARKDRRVSIQEVKSNGFRLSFFWSWDQEQYGASVDHNGRLVEETFCGMDLPEPELPGKRLCQAFWKAFVDYADGDESYAPAFEPKPPADARTWGRSIMAALTSKYVPAVSDYTFN